MPGLEIVTMSNHRLSFPVHPPIQFLAECTENNLSRLLMVTFGNQTANHNPLKMVI
jgi:hypothetical protein